MPLSSSNNQHFSLFPLNLMIQEKTSQAFRDALHEQYKSSTVAKKKRRQREHARVSVKLNGTRSDAGMSKRLDNLSSKVARSGKTN
jgi:hypothetical protein